MRRRLLFAAVFFVTLGSAWGCASSKSTLLDGTSDLEYHTERYLERCQLPEGLPPEDCPAYYTEIAALKKELVELVSAMELGSDAKLQRAAVERRVKAIEGRYGHR